ncbi:MAG TPA: fasciclin domain-containing protein, partial [Pedobacter sp.]
MKKMIKAIAFVSALFMMGCKDDYFSDDLKPVDQSGVLGVTTMEYLRNNPSTFDTLTRLIKITGLESAVDEKGSTFLAPRDFSIHNYFKLLYPDPANMPATLDALPQPEKDRIAEIIRYYIIPKNEILSGGLATTYSYVVTSAGIKARFNAVTTDYLGNINLGARFVNFSLNIAPAGSAEQYKTVSVATSDLRSTTGVLH